MSHADNDRSKNRDDELKPGVPPRHASEPAGAEGSARNAKTLTDPATGAPRGKPPDPARSPSDDAPPRN
jgi:hypothetical protein